MKFDWMAYDIVQDGGKFKILEWTCNFGCKGPKEHGIDVREKMVDYMILNYKKNKK